MADLNFLNGIKEFNYEKYGIYIPFWYHTKNIISELYEKWDEERRVETSDDRYKRDLVMGNVNGKPEMVVESANDYLSSLMWNDYPLNSLSYNLSEMLLDLGYIIDELSNDKEVIIGKYKIVHTESICFAYDDDGDLVTDKYDLYCKNELIFTIYGRGFKECIGKIIEHANGFESWKMINEVD